MKSSPNAAKDSSQTAKTKRKSREDIEAESRARKREKKHRGHVAGARTNVESQSGKNSNGNATAKDPRIGSKKPVPLIVEGNKPAVAKPKVIKAPKPPKISPEEQLALLENDERLNQLLDAIDDGKTLSGEEQEYVDNTLDRIDELMEKLGIDLGDDDDDQTDDESAAKEDIIKLLKTNTPK
ncbi:MAG: Der GTPase-activating protein YihI [Enterobacteriaceae bacterium]|jgi:ribosome assembly protein YihI (activator of Der GTPase)|nr:Der GTPase-activating protein YihI [Enterobacteriaceae bacterium]